MRVDKQTISYWSMNEKEHALVIDVLQHIANGSPDTLAELLGEKMSVVKQYRREVRDLLQQVGEGSEHYADDSEATVVTPLTEEEVAEINKEAADTYGPFRKSSR